jgi:hypothetical protein
MDGGGIVKDIGSESDFVQKAIWRRISNGHSIRYARLGVVTTVISSAFIFQAGK